MCDNKTFKTNLNQNHLSQIKHMISSQSNEINRIQLFLTNIVEIYNEYINLSKEFSKI